MINQSSRHALDEVIFPSCRAIIRVVRLIEMRAVTARHRQLDYRLALFCTASTYRGHLLSLSGLQLLIWSSHSRLRHIVYVYVLMPLMVVNSLLARRGRVRVHQVGRLKAQRS